MSNRKPFNDRAGYVASRKNPVTGIHNVIYKAEEQGIDVDGCKYAVVFEAQDRARAKAYASEQALTLEYISRLEEIARASLVLLKHDMLYVDPVAEPKRSAVYNALRAVDLLDM